MKKTLLPIIIALLFLNISYAHEDFEAYADIQINAYACAVTNSEVTLHNKGEETSFYDFEPKAKTVEVTLSPGSVTLKPGELANIKQEFSVPCNAKNQEIKTIISTTSGIKKQLIQKLNILKPENIYLIPHEVSKKINTCDSAKFKIELVNPLNFEETYSFKASPKNTDVSFSEEKITLSPSESKNLTITVNNKCGAYGKIPLKLLINTENSKLVGEIDLKLDVSNDYYTKTRLSKGYLKNFYSKESVDLTIENVGEKPSNYEIRIRNADWVTAEEKSLIVSGKKSKVIKISVSPPNSVKEGVYEPKIIVKSLDNGQEFEHKLTIQVKKKTVLDAYLYGIVFAGITGTIFVIIMVAVLIKVLKSEKHKNKKLLKKQLRAQKRAEKQRLKEEVISKKYELILLRELEKQKNLTWFLLKKTFLITFLIVLIAGFAFLIFYFKDLLINNWKYTSTGAFVAALILIIIFARKTIKTDKETLNVLNLELAKLKQKENLKNKQNLAELKKISNDYNSLKSFFIIIVLALLITIGLNYKTFSVQFPKETIAGLVLGVVFLIVINFRTGSKICAKWKMVVAKQDYAVDTKWRNGLTHIDFSIKKSTEGFKLVVKKMSQHRINPSNNNYKFYKIISNIDDKLFESVKHHLKVKKSWLIKRNINFEDIELAFFTGGYWDNISTELINDDGTYVYYTAVTNSVGDFAIVTKTDFKEKPSKKPLIFGSLILGVIVVLTIFFLTDFKNDSTIGIPKQNIEANSMTKIDLKPFFMDPDNEALEYSTIASDHLDIDIIDSVALLKPEKDWTGETFAKFKVKDPSGTEAESNLVKVTVFKPLIPTKYKQPIILTTLGALFVILFIMLIKYRNTFLKYLEGE